MIRKKRSDRSYLIYQYTNTLTEEIYIGVTVIREQSIAKTLKIRTRQHVFRSLKKNFDRTLDDQIREYGPEVFEMSVLEKVRGRKNAHARERELTKEMGASLNTL